MSLDLRLKTEVCACISINYIQSNDKQLYVSTGVVEELDKEWAGPYGVNDWLDPIRNEDWIVAFQSRITVRESVTALP